MGLQALLMNSITSRSLEVLDLSDNPLVTNQAMDFNPTASFLSNPLWPHSVHGLQLEVTPLPCASPKGQAKANSLYAPCRAGYVS